MLPSRLLRSVGVPPALRSPLLLHPRLSSTVRLQILCRLHFNPVLHSMRRISTATPRLLRASLVRRSTASTSSSSSSNTSAASVLATNRQPMEEKSTEPRLQLTFTCAVEGCADRSTHTFTRRSYERGIVIVQCPKCKNRHLIADHLGWFKTTDGTGEGQFRTIEDMMQAKGEKVRRGRVDAGGVVEYSE